MSISSWFDPITAGLTLLAGLLLHAPAGDDTAPKTLDDETRGQVLERVLEELERGYVFPEVAKRMEEEVHARVVRGEYASLTDPDAFARALTHHLQGVSKDKHLRVRFHAEAPPGAPPPRAQGEAPRPRQGPSDDEVREHLRVRDGWRNYGFERVERLPGNVGYLDLRGFVPPVAAEATGAAAMNLLANTDAMIVDLRQNGGGAPESVAFLASWFFGEEPVHLNSLYNRPNDETEHFWTRRELPGPRYLDKPVYLLTSSRTFSAAEEFAYDLQCLGRATVVGETSGGGANPGEQVRVGEHFSLFVPTGRAINPITKTNWEGVGVKPDVAVPAERALDEAHARALDALAAKAPGRGPLREEIARERERLRGRLAGAAPAQAR